MPYFEKHIKILYYNYEILFWEGNIWEIKWENTYARNEIYARHGYVFKEDKFKNYFKTKSWYKENPSFTGDDSKLNEYEKANRDLFKKYEDKLKKSNTLDGQDNSNTQPLQEDEDVLNKLVEPITNTNNEFPEKEAVKYIIRYFVKKYNKNIHYLIMQTSQYNGSYTLIDESNPLERLPMNIHYYENMNRYSFSIKSQVNDSISGWTHPETIEMGYVDNKGFFSTK